MLLQVIPILLQPFYDLRFWRKLNLVLSFHHERFSVLEHYLVKSQFQHKPVCYKLYVLFH